MKRVYMETYGCSANQAHAETMQGVLADNGFSIVKNSEKADVLLINTCIVKSQTENKIRHRLMYLAEKYPRKKMLIAGCAADVGLFRNIAKNAAFLSSLKPEDAARLLKNQTKESKRKARRNPLVGITEIASGCLGNCAYCIVRLAKGDLKSRSPEAIVQEVENAIKEGCEEIWVTSQDCGCYGLDKKTDLAELLEKIVGIKGNFRIRIGMMNPVHIEPITDALIDIYKNPKIYKFVHIPVQSGSDRILRLMKRGYGAGDFEKIVERFRGAVGNMTLSTDIIVGFPGETEQDFCKTLEMIKRVKPDIVNLSKFGPRPGTEAAKMKQVENRIIKERSSKIARLLKEIETGKNMEWIGKECEIVITERGKKANQFMGRNESYKPVVVESKKNLMGKVLRVRISDADQTYLSAEIIQKSA
jgi:threonylcarbamoyladenosine tRNA methylthiotransferase CDKAL1